MSSVSKALPAALALALCLPATVFANPFGRCSNDVLRGRYVFAASGFTRTPNSLPGMPWSPKAILEVLQFHGNGKLDTPALVAANPFGDTGGVLQPPSGAPGEYAINADCTGTIHFFDANNVTFSVYVDPRGETIRMIQTSPVNNVFEGVARRQ
jgi:hypothetical protein